MITLCTGIRKKIKSLLIIQSDFRLFQKVSLEMSVEDLFQSRRFFLIFAASASIVEIPTGGAERFLARPASFSAVPAYLFMAIGAFDQSF